jgi:hypothetical protein
MFKTEKETNKERETLIDNIKERVAAPVTVKEATSARFDLNELELRVEALEVIVNKLRGRSGL